MNDIYVQVMASCQKKKMILQQKGVDVFECNVA